MNAAELSGRRVIIAGAGLAGLTAAYELQRHGAHVTVIEARERVGGRVLTIRHGFHGGQHAEAGGDFIDEEQEDICRLATTLHVTLQPVLRHGFSFARGASGGRIVREGHGGSLWALVGKHLEPWLRAHALAERQPNSPVIVEMARTPVARWFKAAHVSPQARALVTGLRGFFLADPDELSLLTLVEQLASGVPGRSRIFRVKGGNDRLVAALAHRLNRPVVLRTAVTAVRQRSRRMLVSVNGPDGRSQLGADYVVLALPCPLLRHVRFEPRLPSMQHDAIARLPYGRVTKTLIQFERAFWRRPGHPRAYGTDLPTGAVWDASEGQRGRAGILALMAGGSASRDTQRILKRGGLAALVKRLRWLGASSVRVLIAHSVTWEHDRLARGGYASFDWTYNPEWRQWLARPHGRVLFAGEHTSLEWQGYMNGAVQSGLRAAAEIAALERKGGQATCRGSK